MFWKSIAINTQWRKSKLCTTSLSKFHCSLWKYKIQRLFLGKFFKAWRATWNLLACHFGHACYRFATAAVVDPVTDEAVREHENWFLRERVANRTHTTQLEKIGTTQLWAVVPHQQLTVEDAPEVRVLRQQFCYMVTPWYIRVTDDDTPCVSNEHAFVRNMRES